jgi:hypothetical protein
MLAFVLAACTSVSGPATYAAYESVSGVVISADGPDASRVDGFSLRTSGGQVLSFTVGVLDLENGGLPAPHLREHLVTGAPITVYYSDDGNGGLVAMRYVDADQ